MFGVYIQKGKQKSPERATSRSHSQPPTPGGREKVAQNNVCIANKQMHDKHNDHCRHHDMTSVERYVSQSPILLTGDVTCA